MAVEQDATMRSALSARLVGGQRHCRPPDCDRMRNGRARRLFREFSAKRAIG